MATLLQSGCDAMIKLLHFADLHLGVENYGRLDPGTGLSTRLGDFLRSLDAIVEQAISADVDIVVFAGDAYQTTHPSPTNQREFARRIRRLSEANIPVFLLTGNHDLPLSIGKAASTEIFSTLDVPSVFLAHQVSTQLIETKSGPLQVVALPWPVRSHLLTRAEMRGRSSDEVSEALTETVTDLVRKEIEALDPQLPTVLAAHVTVFGAEIGHGLDGSVFLGREIVIPSSLLANPAFDYVALGHLHRHQVIREASPPVVYSGSVERIDFGEEKEDKGFVMVDLEKGSAQLEFVPLATRGFLTIEVEAKGSDPTAEVLQAIEAQEVQDKVVRVIVRTSAGKEPLLNETEIFAALRSAFHVAALIKDVERSVRLRIGGRNYEEMTTRQILETYLRVKEVPRERAELLLRYADQLEEDDD
jgi:exonuclease SbcD